MEQSDLMQDMARRINDIDNGLSGHENAMIRQGEAIERLKAELNTQNTAMQRTLSNASSTINEVLWAQIFNNTVTDSQWLRNKTFSPGRWAIGYPYLYVLYRVLDIVKPKSILELGLGQSTRMVSQYASFHDAAHDVAEHDKNWIGFFSKDFGLPKQTKVTLLELIERQYLNADGIKSYRGFKETFTGRKYDLISIDGPFGTLGKVYSRVDILDILPGCLSNSFVIMVDDYNRDGEKRTADEIARILKQSGIPFRWGFYSGQKSLCVIVSPDMGFICSL